MTSNSDICGVCDGFGMVKVDGGMMPCYACRAKKFLADSNIRPAYHATTLDVLDSTWGRGTQDLIRCARQVMQKPRQYWLAVVGSTGNGKTTMLYSVCNYFNRMGADAARAQYWTMPNLMTYLKEGMNTPGSSFSERLNKILAVPVLAIDEVDKVQYTDFNLQTMTTLVDERWDAARAYQQITLWVMNAEPSSAWLKSRLFDSAYESVEILSPDMRLEMPSRANEIPHDFLDGLAL